MGNHPTKTTSKDVWFLSPFRNEKTASFKVNIQKNIYYDFGEGKGGNALDFIMQYFNCDLKEALHILKLDFSSFSFHQQPIKKDANERKKTYEFVRVKNIVHPALKEYLIKTRKLNFIKARRYCKEVHYAINKQLYFAIGFPNDKGGYEIRNKYVKLCLGKKAITTIKNDSTACVLFESWSDFVAFLCLFPRREYDYDYIILNSVSLLDKVLKAKERLKSYKTIIGFFDNDKAGDRATEKLLKSYPKKGVDNRKIYQNYKDANAYLASKC